MRKGQLSFIGLVLILSSIAFAQTYPNDSDFEKGYQWGLNNTDYPGMDINAKSA